MNVPGQEVTMHSRTLKSLRENIKGSHSTLFNALCCKHWTKKPILHRPSQQISGVQFSVVFHLRNETTAKFSALVTV